jgi:hypothetical protein
MRVDLNITASYVIPKIQDVPRTRRSKAKQLFKILDVFAISSFTHGSLTVLLPNQLIQLETIPSIGSPFRPGSFSPR